MHPTVRTVDPSPSQAYFEYAPPALVHSQETIQQRGSAGPRIKVTKDAIDKRQDRIARSLDWLPVPPTETEVSFRHSGWAPRRARVYAGLKAAGMPEQRIERFLCCGSSAMVQRQVGSRKLRVVANYCHDRFCLPCASTRSRVIARNLSQFMGESVARHIVLTLKHREEPLATQVNRLVKSFAMLRRRDVWTDSIRGGGYFIEIKRSKCGKFWHPHLHVVAIGSYIHQADLSAAWKAVTVDSSIVYVQLIRNKSEVVNYAAKYASKPLDPSIFKDDDWLGECIRSLTGRRLCGCFGEWRGRGLEDEPEDQGEWVNVGWVNALAREAASGNLGSLAVLKLLKPRWEWFNKGDAGCDPP